MINAIAVPITTVLEVSDLLTNPDRLEREHHGHTRIEPASGDVEALKAQRLKLQHALERLIDGFTEGLIEKDHFTSRMARTKSRIADLDPKIKDEPGDADHVERMRIATRRLRQLAAAVGPHLENTDWSWTSRHDSNARSAYRDRIGDHQDCFPHNAGRRRLKIGVHCCNVIASGNDQNSDPAFTEERLFNLEFAEIIREFSVLAQPEMER